MTARPGLLWALLALPAMVMGFPTLSQAAAPARKPLKSAPVERSAAVEICYNYGCATEANVTFTGRQLIELRRLLGAAGNSEDEREVLARVIGRMYAWAAEQTPIGSDRAGNYADGGMPGQMDCIDHSATTTRFLRMLESRGWLRFHRVLDPVRRLFLLAQHFSAAIEDLGDGVSVIRTDDEARTWVVDSWYVNNGKPAWVAPLDKWERDDGGPDF